MHHRVKRVAVVGASQGIGAEMVQFFSHSVPDISHVFVISSQPLGALADVNIYPCPYLLSYDNVDSFNVCAHWLAEQGGVDWLWISCGQLHSSQCQPEKTVFTLRSESLYASLHANTVVPTLVVQSMLAAMPRVLPKYITLLSARVGSISDNHLGGWYSYRSAKAALNMMIKCLAIELSRIAPDTIVVGLHPGTVDTALSKPFQRRISEHRLFTPTECATYLYQVVAHLRPEHSGRIWAWDGQEIQP